MNNYENSNALEESDKLIKQLINPVNISNSCISIKSRKEKHIQCSHSKKKGFDYCGRHLKGKKIIYKTPPSNTQIIKLQSFIRKANVINRHRCINDDDFFTCDTKYEIPSHFFFKTTDNYFFDIRTLYKYFLESGKHINPYTTTPFDKKTMKSYKKHLKYIIKSKYNIRFQENNISSEEEYKNKLLKVFQKFDALDHYTDTEWFNMLSLIHLKKLYLEAEDIWNYRIQMTPFQRNRIVPGGSAFQHQQYIIRGFGNDDKRELQNIILDEFDKFVS